MLDISYMSDWYGQLGEASVIVSRNTVESRANSIIKSIERSDAKLSQNSLHLRPEFFNRIQIRTVWRQIKDFRSSTMQQFTHRLDMVGPEIVHYHDIPWAESRN